MAIKSIVLALRWVSLRFFHAVYDWETRLNLLHNSVFNSQCVFPTKDLGAFIFFYENVLILG